MVSAMGQKRIWHAEDQSKVNTYREDLVNDGGLLWNDEELRFGP